jgi:hypothetical protein
MRTKDFLFPCDLEITETKLEKILFIGSCLAETYQRQFVKINPALQCDLILFNNAVRLSPSPPSPANSYQLQYLQIPLRSVLTDSVVRIGQLDDPAYRSDFIRAAEQNLDRFLECALEYNRSYGLLTLVAGFVVPQGYAASSLSAQNTPADLKYIVSHLNACLVHKLKEYKNVCYADIEMIAASMVRFPDQDDR